MDAEDYSTYPASQFEEDNVLRELNKCLLAFRQNTTCPILPSTGPRNDRRPNSLPLSGNNAGRDAKDKERHNSVQRRYNFVQL